MNIDGETQLTWTKEDNAALESGIATVAGVSTEAVSVRVVMSDDVGENERRLAEGLELVCTVSDLESEEMADALEEDVTGSVSDGSLVQLLVNNGISANSLNVSDFGSSEKGTLTYFSAVQRWLRAKIECMRNGQRLAEALTADRAREIAQAAADQGAPEGQELWVGAKDKGIGLVWSTSQEPVDLPLGVFKNQTSPHKTSTPNWKKFCMVMESGSDVDAKSLSCTESLPFMCES